MNKVEASADERLLLTSDGAQSALSTGAAEADRAKAETPPERIHVPMPTSDQAISRKVRAYVTEQRPDLADDPIWLGMLCTYFIFRRHVERLNRELTTGGVLVKQTGKIKEAFGVLTSASRELRALLDALPPPPARAQGPARVIISTVCSECGPPVEGVSIFDDDGPSDGDARPPRHPAEVTPAEGGKPHMVIQSPPDPSRAPEQHAHNANLRGDEEEPYRDEEEPYRNVFTPIRAVDDQQHDHPKGGCRLC